MRRLLFFLLAFFLLPTSGRAQRNLYLYPNVGALKLDFDALSSLGVGLDEGTLVGLAGGLNLSDSWSIEIGYASAGFEVGVGTTEPLEGRFHLIGLGPRATLLSVQRLDVSASLMPGLVIATTELTDATRNLALPAGLDVGLSFSDRLGVRIGVVDYLHLCDPPEGFDGVICDDGEWLHHISGSAGFVLQL